MQNRTKQDTRCATRKQGPAPTTEPSLSSRSQQEMDERLHEALIMSFDCGDPVAITIG